MQRIHGSNPVSVVTNDVVMTGNKLVSHDHEIGLSIQAFFLTDSSDHTTTTTNANRADQPIRNLFDHIWHSVRDVNYLYKIGDFSWETGLLTVKGRNVSLKG